MASPENIVPVTPFEYDLDVSGLYDDLKNCFTRIFQQASLSLMNDQVYKSTANILAEWVNIERACRLDAKLVSDAPINVRVAILKDAKNPDLGYVLVDHEGIEKFAKGYTAVSAGFKEIDHYRKNGNWQVPAIGSTTSNVAKVINANNIASKFSKKEKESAQT